MRMTFFLLLSLTLTGSLIAQHIRFISTELYPEGSAYSPKLKTFFVSSVHYGKLGKVDLSGNYTPFVDDQELVTTAGLLADDERGLLYVCIADPGVSIKTNPQSDGLKAMDASVAA